MIAKKSCYSTCLTVHIQPRSIDVQTPLYPVHKFILYTTKPMYTTKPILHNSKPSIYTTKPLCLNPPRTREIKEKELQKAMHQIQAVT